MVARPWTAWWRASSFWRQSRRIFPFFIRAEGVLNAGAGASVFSAVFLLASQEGASGPSVVRDGQAGAAAGAVRDHRRGCQGRLLPHVGVGHVARRRPGRGLTMRLPAVCVDDDLHVRRGPGSCGRRLRWCGRGQGTNVLRPRFTIGLRRRSGACSRADNGRRLPHPGAVAEARQQGLVRQGQAPTAGHHRDRSSPAPSRLSPASRTAQSVSP